MVGRTLAQVLTDGNPDQFAKGNIRGISTPKVGETIGGKAVSAQRPTWWAHFARLSAQPRPSLLDLLLISILSIENCRQPEGECGSSA
jgi:hypothetical protein